jgi:hypothetical protein
MAVLKMREANTHRPIYIPGDEISLVEGFTTTGRSQTPQDFVCPIRARVYRKGIPNGVTVCVESFDVLEAMMGPKAAIQQCDEPFTVDPASVKFVHVPVG